MSDAFRTLSVVLTANTTQFTGAMVRAGDQVTAFALGSDTAAAKAKVASASLSGMSKGADDVAKSFLSAKTAIAGLGTAIALGLGVATKEAIHFQQEMTKLNTQADARLTTQQMKALEQQVLGLSAAVGFGPTSLAEGLYHVASAGIPAAKQLDVLRKSAELARVSGANLEDTTNAVIGVMNGFRSQNLSAADAAGYLNATVGAGNIRMQQLARAIGTGVLPVFEQAGLSMKDFGATIAVFGDNVTDPIQASTRLKQTISELTNPTNEAKKSFRELHLNTTQLANDMRQPDGLLVAIGDLKAHYDELAKTEGPIAALNALQNAFGKSRGSTYIVELVSEFDLLKQKYENQNFQAPALSLEQSWKLAQATVSVQLKQLEAGFEAFGVRVGLKVLPGVSKALTEMQSVARNDSVKQFLHGMGDDLGVVEQNLAKVWHLIVDVGHDVGPVAVGFAAVTAKSITEGLRVISDLLGPIANFLDHNRVLVDALATAWGVRYVTSIAAARLSTLAFTAALGAEGLAGSLTAVEGGLSGVGGVARLAGAAGFKTASTSALGLAVGLESVGAAALPMAAVVAGIAAPLYLYKKSADEAAAASSNLKKAIETNNSVAIDDSIAKASKNIQPEIAKLGLTYGDFSNAVQGGKDSQRQFADAIIRSSPALQNSTKMQDELRLAVGGNEEAFNKLATQFGKLPDGAGQLIQKMGDLSQQFDKDKAGADAFKASNDAMTSSLPGSTAALQSLGTAASDAATNQQNLVELQKELSQDLAGFTDPKSALTAAAQAQQEAQKAATKSTKANYSEQKKALQEAAQSDIRNLQDRKSEVVNGANHGRSAIQDEISARRDQLAADKDALDSAQKTGQGSAAATAASVKDQIVSLQSYIKELDKENAARDAWLENLNKIAASPDLGAGIATQLAKLGPQGAGIAQQLADDVKKGTPAAKEQMQHLTSSLLASSNAGLDQVASDASKKWIVMAEIAKQGADATVSSVSQALGSTPQEISALVSQWGVSLAGGLNPILAATGNQPISTGAHPGAAPAGANISSYYANNPANVDKPMSAHANGSFENHQAQIAGAGEMRLWAEPETGGEAYIPLAHSKRPRSMGILAKTADMFGMALVAQAGGYAKKFADGGFATGEFNLPQPPKMPPFLFGKVADQVDQFVYKKAVDFAQTKQSNQGNYGEAAAGAPKGQVVDWIHAAEQIAGWPDSYTNGLYQLIMHESGGNPKAINLWDSNAKAGHPSQGLMQTIPGTFKAYAFPGHGDILNPVDNILAGTSYALKNYGPSMVTAGGRRDAKGNYLGYADGGIYKGTYDRGGPLMPGYTMAYNGTGKPEHVLTEKMVEQIVGAVKQSRGGHQINVIADAKSVAETARVVGRKLR